MKHYLPYKFAQTGAPPLATGVLFTPYSPSNPTHKAIGTFEL